jgi:hypothetical protein
MKHLKSIYEDFAGGDNAYGDTYGFGGANGILKINYKPFADLSVSVGRDPNIPNDVKGAKFQIGDAVIGKSINPKDDKKYNGVIVRSFRTPDNREYRYFIQVYNKGKKTERVIEIKSDSIKFAPGGDHGHIEIDSRDGRNQSVPKKYNSDTVYTSNDLGLETVGG